MPGFVTSRLQSQQRETVIERCQLIDPRRRLTDQRAQFAQGRILIVARLDFLGIGKLIAGLGFEDIGASPLPLLEQLLVLLELLLVGLLAGDTDADLVFGEQRLCITGHHPH
ncbi:hypothetical protein D3C75_1148470 [compost metagenome]